MFSNKSVDVHRFSMIPKADIPRSSFRVQHTHKTTIDAGYLYPIYVDEVLPGDTHTVRMTAFARLSTPLFPIMDNLHCDFHFFYVPDRLVWTNFVKMMGEQDNPGDSISYTTPQIVSGATGFVVGSLFDYFGLPTVGQATAGAISVSAMFSRAYNLIWNTWFRDQNLQNSVVVDKDDGPDTLADYVLLRRGKRHDYFTSALPWPQKGNTAVSLPLGTTAPVYGNGKALGITEGTTNYGLNAQNITNALSGSTGNYNAGLGVGPSGAGLVGNQSFGVVTSGASGLYADLSTATAATINQLRQAFQIQKFLEREARGGSRYVELILSQFGVRSPDARLQRPEYLGGGSVPISVNPVAQTSGTSASGTTTPLGNLAGTATLLAHGIGFSQSFVEHGMVIGLASVRADLTYQQGIRKMWKRSTRFDRYTPVFATLGEQTVLNQEIYADGSANDVLVFGYQERWAEYRYNPSIITGLFRSTSSGTIDPWHLAQKFATLPTLNATFIADTPPLERVIAVGSAANGKQLLFDSFFDAVLVRPMPLYSVPGLIDHF